MLAARLSVMLLVQLQQFDDSQECLLIKNVRWEPLLKPGPNDPAFDCFAALSM